MGRSESNDADRARELRAAARTNPEDVDIDAVVRLLVRGEREARRIAIDAYDEATSARPEAAETAATALESDLRAESAETRRRAALTAAVLVDRDPSAFASVVPALDTVAADPSEPGRDPAAAALGGLAIERPAAVAPAAETLLSVAHSRIETSDDPAVERVLPETTAPGETGGPVGPERQRRDEVRVRSVAGLTRIAAERPEAVRDHAPRVAALLADDHHLVRAGACEVLESVAAAFPDAVEPFATDLADRVAADTQHPVPWRAADALNAVGRSFPGSVGEAVAPVADELGSFLDARDPGIRGVGVGLLTYAAEASPSSVASLAPTVRERLDDDRVPIRANAALVLGLIDATDAREDLERLAAEDSDEHVRAVARRSLERFRRIRPGSIGGKCEPNGDSA